MNCYLVTGSQGFIGSFLCDKLLKEGHKVIGVDDYSKYGEIKRSHDNHKNFTFYKLDISKSKTLFKKIVKEHKPTCAICFAAMIGGISYFHEFPYDLLAVNEQIMINTYFGCLNSSVERMVIISSSMVYEGATSFPCKEEPIENLPLSSYGFQKLATEYFAKAAYDQYKLPYTIIRPFNAVGIGEDKAIACSTTRSGNIKLTLSHVLPDLIHKVLAGQNPLHILGEGNQVRCYTNGKDIAEGIYLSLNSDINQTFNISSDTPTTVLELAQLIWNKLRHEEFKYVTDQPFKHDVPFRLPDVSKAEKVLGFKAKISLEQSVDEVINYFKN